MWKHESQSVVIGLGCWWYKIGTICCEEKASVWSWSDYLRFAAIPLAISQSAYQTGHVNHFFNVVAVPSSIYLSEPDARGRTDNVDRTIGSVWFDSGALIWNSYQDDASASRLAELGVYLCFLEEQKKQLAQVFRYFEILSDGLPPEEQPRTWTAVEVDEAIWAAQQAQGRHLALYKAAGEFAAFSLVAFVKHDLKTPEEISARIVAARRARKAIKSALLTLRRAVFCGVSWCKRVWFLMHGNRPPHGAGPSIGLCRCLGCATA